MTEPSEQPPPTGVGAVALIVAVALIATAGTVAILGGSWKPPGVGVRTGFPAWVVGSVRDRLR